jgi:predicted phosphate transport protein (TIGR00153 family)
MFLEKLLAPGKKEQVVIEGLTKHIKLLCSAIEVFQRGLEEKNKKLMDDVKELEREADIIRREVISRIYEGAFLPYLRPSLCKLTELVDNVFDCLEDAAYLYQTLKPQGLIQKDVDQVASLNLEMCRMLLISFEALMSGGDLREKALAIRVYEKKIDDIKFDLLADLRTIPVSDFWEGKTLSDFVSSLISISDVIEDASDYLEVINVSLR